jgi:hypothetical protein
VAVTIRGVDPVQVMTIFRGDWSPKGQCVHGGGIQLQRRL